MNLLGEFIRKHREKQGLLLRHLAANIDIDTAMMSKIERGERRIQRHQLGVLAQKLELDVNELTTIWLSDKICKLLKGEKLAFNAIHLAEKQLSSTQQKPLIAELQEPQLALFFSEKSTNPPSIIDKSYLGQVFTPDILARFMVKLLQKAIPNDASILDPCIGPNTFFSHWEKMGFFANLTGIEIDQSLINEAIRKFYTPDNRTLINDDFFNFSVEHKFDAVIQNPPYVRQELLLHQNKVKAVVSTSSLFALIPSKSNLYVYFLLKSIVHLKAGGVLLAVLYDSWLFSQYGQFLKKTLLQLGHLEHIYHFRNHAFPDAEVGATVIQFRKKQNSLPIKYTSFWSIDELRTYVPVKITSAVIPIKSFLTYKFNGNVCLNFKQSLFVPLKECTKNPIRRGTSAIVNEHFIHKEPTFKEHLPFLKDISKIPTFSARQATAYLLVLTDKLSKETNNYVEQVKEKILATKGKFVAVKRNIQAQKAWFKVNVKPVGNFIFNYYMRNNVDFIYNEAKYIASDNFYLLNIDQSPMAHLALLNSSFTRLAVLAHSRSQGSGLKKIQAYEFKEVPIIDLHKIPAVGIEKLEKLGIQLKNTNRYKEEKNNIIARIDKVLLEVYNLNASSKITMEQIKKDLSFYFK